MRVAIDATPLTLSSGGLARYTSQLAGALAREYSGDEYFLLSDQPFPNPDPLLKLGRAPRSSIGKRWWLWGLPRELRRLRADVFHGGNFTVPYLPLTPSVVTVHDLSPWMNPAWHSGAARVRSRTPWLLKLGLATMVITDSEAVRRQAIDFFRLHPGRVVAVPLAADERFRPVSATPGGRAYFLFVGTLEPRKNVQLLIEAWRPVHEQYGVDLVLVGRPRADSPAIAPEPGLRIDGEVPDEALPMLYSGALAVAYPSLYEGFGLPVLEAMQCGACVITSTDPAVAEVSGDAALRLDAGDVRAWSRALDACARGGEWMAGLRERALKRAARFSWAQSARMTRGVYAEAIQRFQL